MSKPDWKDAPALANWLAMDSDGLWWWFQLEPYQHPEGLWATYGASWVASKSRYPSDSSCWIKTLERRP